MTLLRQIQDAALDSTTSLPDLLRRCKVLAARLKHQDFAEWVDRELQGYPDAKKIPTYRRIHVQSMGHFRGAFGLGVDNAPLPPKVFPKELRKLISEQPLTASVMALEKLAASDEGVLRNRWPPDMIAHVQHNVEIYENMALVDAFKLLSVASIAGVLDTVRTRVLEFALALEELDPNAGDSAPGERPRLASEQVANIYYNTVINGGVASVGTGGNSSIKTGSIRYSPRIPKEQRAEIHELLEKLRTEAEENLSDPSDLTEAAGVLDRIEEQLSKPKPAIERINKYLQLYAAIVTVASPTYEQLQILLPTVLDKLGFT